jgi:hypothetical protein
MSAVMERESKSVLAALDAASPRAALRETIRETLYKRGYSRPAIVEILDNLADDLRAKGRSEDVAVVVEALEILVGETSPFAVRTYLGK